MSWPTWPTAGVAPPTVVQGPVINSAPNVINPAAASMMGTQQQYTPEQWASMQQHNWQQWAQWQQQFQQWQQQYGAEYQKSLTALNPPRGNAAQPPVPYYNMSAAATQPPLPLETKPPPPPDDSHGGLVQQPPPPQPQVQIQPPLPQTAAPTAPNVASLYANAQYSQPPPILPSGYSTAPPPPSTAPPKEQYQYSQIQQHNVPPKNQSGYENRNVAAEDNQMFNRNQNFTQNRSDRNNANWQNQGNKQQQGSYNKGGDFGVKRPFNQQYSERGDMKRNRVENQPDGNRWQGGNKRNQKWNDSGTHQGDNQQWRSAAANERNQPEQQTDYFDPIDNQRQQGWGEASANQAGNRQQMHAALSAPKVNIDEPSEAEKKFDKQFADWEAQFQKWKDQNVHHPDSSQYKEYEKKWVTWRAQLLERREQMRRKRLGITADMSVTPKPEDIQHATITEDHRENIHSKALEATHQIPHYDETPVHPQIGPQVIPPLMGNFNIEGRETIDFEHSGKRQPLLPTPELKQQSSYSKPSLNANNQSLDTIQSESLAVEHTRTEEENEQVPHSEGDTSGFLNAPSGDGIPGLDLVKEGDENVEDVTEEQGKKPDLDAISRGINSILGDQNLMNMLSLVSQSQSSQPTITNTLNTTASAKQDSPKFSPVEYNLPTEMDNFDEQSQGSYNIGNQPETYNRFHDKENAVINNTSLIVAPNNRGFEPSRSIDNIQGPKSLDLNTFNTGPDNFFKTNENLSRGPNAFNKDSGDFKAPDKFNLEQDNFNREPDNWGEDNFNRGPNKFSQGPDAFNRGPNNLNRGPDSFNHGPEAFNREPDNFNRGSDNFNRGPDNFNRGPDNFNRGPDNFNRGPDTFNCGPDNFNRGPDNFNRGQDNFNRGPDNFNRGPDNFKRGPESINRGPDSFNRGPDGFNRELDPNNRGQNINQGSDSFKRGSDNIGGKPVNPIKGPPSLLDMDFSKSFGNLNRGLGNFNKGTDGKGWETENSMRGSANFDRENLNAGPDSFRMGFNKKGGGNLDRPGLDNFSRGRGLDTSNKGGSDFNRGRSGFNRDVEDNFQGGTDKFAGGGFDNFNRGNDSFNRGGSDNFNRDVVKRGGQSDNYARDRFDRGSDRFIQGSSNNEKPQNFQRLSNEYDRGPENFKDGAHLDKIGSVGPGLKDLNLKISGSFDREAPNLQLNEGSRIEPSLGFEPPSQGSWIKQNVPLKEAVLSPNPEEDMWKPTKVIDYDHKSLKPVEPDILLLPINMFDYRHKLLSRIPFPQRPKWLSDILRNIPDFDNVIGRQFEPQQLKQSFDDRNIFDNRDRLPFDDRDRKLFNNRERKFDDRDRKPFENWDRKVFDNEEHKVINERNRKNFDDRDRSPYDDRVRKPFGDRDRKSYEDRDRKSFDDGDRKSFDGRDRKPFDDKERKSFDRDRKSFGERDRKSFDDRDRKFTDGRDRKPFEDRDRRPFDDRDRKPFEDRDRKPFEDRDRKPFEDRDRKPFEDRDRKPFEDRDRKPFEDRDRKPFEDRDRKPFEDRDRQSGEDRDRKPVEDRRSGEGRKNIDDREKRVFNEKESDRKSYDNDRKQYDDRDRKRSDDHDRKAYPHSHEDKPKDTDNKMSFNDDKNDNHTEAESALKNKAEGLEQKNNADPCKTDNKSLNKKSNVTSVEDLLCSPGRFNRPPRIVIILRGPPGSGKSHLAKLIKDKEVENGGSAPRIICLDDYFMVEQDKEVDEDGKKVTVKEMVYEYEECMEASYRQSLMKSFKKTITDGYFTFIIVDNVNDKVKYFGEMWSFAKQNGFQVYICELDLDVQACTKRNIHARSEIEIERCVAGWEMTPAHHPILDASTLLEADTIEEVEMEEVNSPASVQENVEREFLQEHITSKWDSFEYSNDNLAKLDGINKPLRASRTMEDFLQMDEWSAPVETKPGQKRVRWADLEEHKKQEKMRAIGFVVGQTNWDRMMDPTMGSSALTQTKYIERYK